MLLSPLQAVVSSPSSMKIDDLYRGRKHAEKRFSTFPFQVKSFTGHLQKQFYAPADPAFVLHVENNFFFMLSCSDKFSM